jgi:hypothetical protein
VVPESSFVLPNGSWCHLSCYSGAIRRGYVPSKSSWQFPDCVTCKLRLSVRLKCRSAVLTYHYMPNVVLFVVPSSVAVKSTETWDEICKKPLTSVSPREGSIFPTFTWKSSPQAVETRDESPVMCPVDILYVLYPHRCCYAHCTRLAAFLSESQCSLGLVYFYGVASTNAGLPTLPLFFFSTLDTPHTFIHLPFSFEHNNPPSFRVLFPPTFV